MKQVMTLFSIILLCYSIFFFMVGFHNVDSCATKKMLILEESLEGYKEKTLDGKIWTFDDCYLTGLNQIIKAFFLIAFATFLLGWFLCELFCSGDIKKIKNKVKKKKK